MTNDSAYILLKKFPILIAMSKRTDGGMKIQNSGEVDVKTHENRKNFLKRYDISPKEIVSASLVHGNTIASVTHTDAGKSILHTDGLITDEKGLFLSITIADCLPVILYHPGKEVIALVHAGWRGLEQHILKKTVAMFQEKFGCNPNELLVSIGPRIGVCHFSVHDDVVEKFTEYPFAVEKREGIIYLDIKAIAQKQLQTTGVREENIEISKICTYCHADTYFSFRKDRSDPVDAMLMVVGMQS